MKNRMTIYWENILNCDTEIIDIKGVHLIPRDNPVISGLLTYKSTIISLPKDRFEYFRDKLNPLYEKHIITYVDILNLLYSDISQCGYLLYQGYGEKEHFTPYNTSNVRLIRKNEMELLENLKRETHKMEWEHSGMNKVDKNIFGFFLNGQIVAVANYLLWGNDSASIGVLTHPSYRNKGYCKAVASAAMQHAFENGLFVLYQTISENKPSVATAKKLGIKDFGLAFRLFVK